MLYSTYNDYDDDFDFNAADVASEEAFNRQLDDDWFDNVVKPKIADVEWSIDKLLTNVRQGKPPSAVKHSVAALHKAIAALERVDLVSPRLALDIGFAFAIAQQSINASEE